MLSMELGMYSDLLGFCPIMTYFQPCYDIS